ncbi:MAG: polysaccharide biosynthesis tyrosine autokinase, partial [Deltaproteobacteria bacterium]|nr:polysaccharide biosynthesis tyrosine autokinase [Deltaproteobacteria bacterium]
MEEIQETTREINLRDYWRVLSKRRWIIILFFLVCLTTVAIYSLTMTPIYQATAQLMIEKANPNILSTQELVAIDTSGTDFYQTQYQILESRSLAREVIKRLNLSQYHEFKRPEKKESNLPGGIAVPVIGNPSPDNDSPLVGAFLGKLKIQPIRNSRLVKVNFESQDPQLAAKVVNTLAQAYIDWGLGLRLKTQQNAAVFLDEQVKEVKRKLEASEQALQQYREKFGVAALTGGGGSKESQGSGSQDISRQKMSQVNAQLVEATNKRIEAEIYFKKAQESLKHPEQAESIPEAINNPVIVDIKSQEVKLLRDKMEKSEKFGPKHPTMVALNQEIESLRKKKFQEIKNLVDAMKSKYEATLAQEHSLQAALGRSQAETINRDKIAIQYQVLQQETESNRGLYDMLLKRLKETNVSEENRTVNIHVVDPAEIPKRPAKPRLKLNLLLACLVGLMGGVGVAFFLEYLDNTVKTPDDLKQYFNVPYLGPVPSFSIESEHPGSELVSLTDPKSSASEAYRGLRTGILFSTPGHSPRSLLITSSGPQEGKTITSSNLAITMAQAGQKIIMLDCDMRKPRLHKVFNCEKGRGMSNILVGEGDWKKLKVSTQIPNLEIIPSGPIPPNPAELIGSDRMKTLLAEILQEYDRVLIDSPPIVAVTDSVLLSRFVEGVVLVIQVGVTARDVIANSIRQLQDVQAHVLGAVLNAVNIGKDSYYYYQYYYYYYGESGDRKKKKHSRRKSK